jgi:predicted dehydrogenase
MAADSKCWGIFGGGFGLYGYLPALVKSGARKVLVLDRHKGFVDARPDINQYLDCVEWLANPQEMLAAANSLVIAVPPWEQESIVRALSRPGKLRYLVIEKPIAHSPSRAEVILALAQAAAASVRVGYICLYTDWAGDFMQRYSLHPRQNYSIVWQFMAHHQQTNQQTWKARHESGGGALRFYGIHLLALLAEVGAVRADSSQLGQDGQGRAVRWVARFRNAQGGTISVDLDCACVRQRFCVHRSGPDGASLVDQQTPFSGPAQREPEDSRIPNLLRLFDSFAQPDAPYYDIYSRADKLWQEVEDLTAVVPLNPAAPDGSRDASRRTVS